MAEPMITTPPAIELPFHILFLPSKEFREALLASDGGNSRVPTLWTRSPNPEQAPMSDWIYGLPVWPEPGHIALEIRRHGENRLSAMDRLVRIISRAHLGRLAPYRVTGMALEHVYTPEKIVLMLRWGEEQGVGQTLRFP